MSLVGSVEAEFLPLIYDIVRSIEKEIHETTGPLQKNNREHHDYYQKIQLLKDKFEKFRDQVNKIPGIELTKDEQLRRLEGLQKQLIAKRTLLQTYKHACPIDAVPKI
ncbi:Mediator of RNA polymerase II transcription subunit 9 [Halotydeus destructor]|nr:Mediator of RNA polymerase II transcription subunit 9 [Halotydeus destructor]